MKYFVEHFVVVNGRKVYVPAGTKGCQESVETVSDLSEQDLSTLKPRGNPKDMDSWNFNAWLNTASAEELEAFGNSGSL